MCVHTCSIKTTFARPSSHSFSIRTTKDFSSKFQRQAPFFPSQFVVCESQVRGQTLVSHPTPRVFLLGSMFLFSQEKAQLDMLHFSFLSAYVAVGNSHPFIWPVTQQMRWQHLCLGGVWMIYQLGKRQSQNETTAAPSRS